LHAVGVGGVVVGVGLQTCLSHVKPAAHVPVGQPVRHWPSAQTFPSAHSLEYLQVGAGGSCCVGSGFVVVPPVQVPALHVLPAPQSEDVLHSSFAPGAVPGGEQSPCWQVSPRGHVASEEQTEVQPVAVQIPEPQLALLVQEGWAGELTREQP
jgi:hypothetical protein